jgi:hypothetical protein
VYDYIGLPDDESYVWRPVMRGIIMAESLFNGDIDLNQIALCNESIDVEQENAWRLQKAQEDENVRK